LKNWLKKQNISFSPKKDNQQNVPQAHPIEKFWAVFTRMVYDDGCKARNKQNLIKKIKKKCKEIDKKAVQDLFQHIRRELRKIEDNGPLSVL
jgi:hypothetical protein